MTSAPVWWSLVALGHIAMLLPSYLDLFLAAAAPVAGWSVGRRASRALFGDAGGA